MFKNLLKAFLGVKPRPPQENLDDFKEFRGLWTKADLKAFEDKTSDTRTVDPGDWQ